jgi:hypothetical protein
LRTLGDVVRQIEDELFVGRADEISAIESWLEIGAGDQRAIVHITGRGGIGKSTLLRRVERAAAERGRLVVHIDGSEFAPTREGLCSALGAGSVAEAVVALSNGEVLLGVDSFDALEPLVPVLRDELLAALPSTTRIVICGRTPLDHRAWRTWMPLVKTIALEPLSRSDSRGYLERRGLRDQEQIEAIVRATRGIPLALGLAADIVARDAGRSVTTSEGWTAMLRGLVDDVAGEASDPRLRALVDAACLVRRFDQDLLEYVLERPCGPEFSTLSSLSFVRRGHHGLSIHDEVRRILESDLRYRNRTLYDYYRQRARQRYEERLAGTGLSSSERAAVLFDAIGLDESVEPHLPPASVEPKGHVTPYSPGDRDVVLRILRECREHHPVARTLPSDEWSEEIVGRILDWPHSKVDVARTPSGDIHGYAFCLPLCAEAIPVLGAQSDIAKAFQMWAETEGRAIPERAEQTRITYASSILYGVHEPEAANAVLMEYGVSHFMRGGVFLALTSFVFYEKALLSVGGRRVLSIESSTSERTLNLFEVDVDAYGVDEWTSAVLSGRTPVRRLTREQITDAVQEALVGWRRDEILAASPLTALVGPAASPGDVRSMLRSVIDTAADDSTTLALQAVRYAYVDRSVSVEAAAERMHVSRATLFRLLKRGVATIAARLDQRVQGE